VLIIKSFLQDENAALNNKSQILRELVSRTRASFRLEDYLFDKQLAFVLDPSPYATAVCSRRAGKTVACAADLIHTALSFPGVVCLYITTSRANAKKIIWEELLSINQRYQLGARINNTELTLLVPNKSRVYCSGAKDEAEVNKFRGMAFKKVYIDEAQSFRSHIRSLVDEVISKALFDYDGQLRLTGTPGPVPAGYFYDCATSPQWAHHTWTMLDNPWLKRKSGKSPKKLIEQDCLRKGVTVDDPTIRRECYGEWLEDSNSLVIRYNKDLNHYEDTPILNNFVLGVDIGHDDADAIVAIGWSDGSPTAYVVEEYVKAGQDISSLATEIDRFIKKYQPLKVVLDTGGLGKKIAEELRKRFSLPVVAAEKARKFEFIEILNDALRTGKLKAKANSTFAEDARKLEWDRDVRNPDKPKVKDTFHSDVVDAVLYAFREALHWLYRPEPPKIVKGSVAWMKQQEDAMWEEASKNLNTQKDEALEGFTPLDSGKLWQT
jgi:phage terminase large subunit